MAEKKKDNTLAIVLIALAVVSTGVGLYLYFKNKKKKPVEEKKVLKDVYDNLVFETGKAVIKPESFSSLDELVDVLKQSPTWVLEIAGHTDSQGNANYNLQLSKDRAMAVANYLKSKGVTNNIITSGYGDKNPIADNLTEEGRAKNRRVEFKIVNTATGQETKA